MTRFVELPIVSDKARSVWINPDHVVAIEASHQLGASYLLTEQGHRPHIALSQEGVVECLDPGLTVPEREEILRQTCAAALRANGLDVDLRDSVRENLNR